METTKNFRMLSSGNDFEKKIANKLVNNLFKVLNGVCKKDIRDSLWDNMAMVTFSYEIKSQAPTINITELYHMSENIFISK